jgi:hypothetical protein
MDETLTALFSAYPRRPGTELIFASPSGGRFTDIRVGFKNACKRAGIAPIYIFMTSDIRTLQTL